MYLHLYFNSQPHKEADLTQTATMQTLSYFNSQPHKEADTWYSKFAGLAIYFNSQPHKEADRVLQELAAIAFAISTHSLTRRLTSPPNFAVYGLTDFNSQPHKEADVVRYIRDTGHISFQLTASQGG